MAENQSNITEEWRPVVGYEGYYSVSNLGRIRRDKGHSGLCKAGRIMKPSLKKNGRYDICLTKNSVQTTHRVHHVVANAFLGPRPVGKQVNHKDGNKTNNRSDNLEYVTAQENFEHSNRLGLRPRGDSHYSHLHPEKVARGLRSGAYTHPETRRRGMDNGRAKLTERDIREIRALLEKKVSVRAIAERFKVGHMAIYRIKSGERWSHIT